MDSRRTGAIVIGAGISGLATLKCLLDVGVDDVILLERSDSVGGLWKFRENEAYGVMAFTHINVSKANYSFSDFPFPADGPDFPHHSEMSAYIHSYAEHFDLYPRIHFNERVTSLNLHQDSQLFHLRTRCGGEERLYIADHVAVASGHHVAPFRPDFPGLEKFNGVVCHSSEFKSAHLNGVRGQALVVGIGNSAVDVAADLARCPTVGKVFLSTRSGAWIFSNYVMGLPTDLYACRFFFLLPLCIGTLIIEWLMSFILGHPNRWGLNPKMRILQTQPTVSPTLVHHIQRGEVEVVPNVERFQDGGATLDDGRTLAVEQVVMCTGYHVGIPFLDDSLRQRIVDPSANEVSLYKNVFSPDVGHRLAFIGFAQPASGGLLPISEMQARWFAELVKGRVKLPPRAEMEKCITEEKEMTSRRYHKSPRHTIQREPILYCDDIAAKIGAKPSLWKHPLLAWKLMFGSCGTAQWRLQGPNAWKFAAREVRKVPVAPLMNFAGGLVVLLLLMVIRLLYSFCASAIF